MQAAGFSVSVRLRDLLFFNIDFNLFLPKIKNKFCSFGEWKKIQINQQIEMPSTDRVTGGSAGRLSADVERESGFVLKKHISEHTHTPHFIDSSFKERRP